MAISWGIYLSLFKVLVFYFYNPVPAGDFSFNIKLALPGFLGWILINLLVWSMAATNIS